MRERGERREGGGGRGWGRSAGKNKEMKVEEHLFK
jgi:hypothetical protein